MARTRKSQTAVGLNAKIESLNLETIPYSGGATFVEGDPVSFGADGSAVKPAGDGTEVVFVNFVDSTRSDVLDRQGDPYQDRLQALNLQNSGHLTGITGSGLSIGLPRNVFLSGVLPTVGQGVRVNADADPDLRKWVGEDIVDDTAYYGIVYRIAENKAYMYFTSRAIVAQIASA